MIYVDTSVFVRALTREPGNERALGWLGRQGAGEVCVSGWTVTEFASAVAIKARRGELQAVEHSRVSLEWQALRAGGVTVLGVPGEAYTVAADLIDDPGSTLRAGDALHLAIVFLLGLDLATLDHGLAQAAAGIGVRVETIV